MFNSKKKGKMQISNFSRKLFNLKFFLLLLLPFTDLRVLEEELAEVGLGYPAAIVPVVLPALQLYTLYTLYSVYRLYILYRMYRMYTLYILYICTLPELQLYHLLQQVRLQGLEGLLGDAL